MNKSNRLPFSVVLWFAIWLPLSFVQNVLNMNEILDEELMKKESEPPPALSSNLKRKAVLYVLIMLVGNFAYDYYQLGGIFISIWWMLLQIIPEIVSILLLSLVLEVFRFFLHKGKERDAKKSIPRDPFWFQTIEGAFAIWILFATFKSFTLLFDFF